MQLKLEGKTYAEDAHYVKTIRDDLNKEILQITEQLEIRYYSDLRVRKTRLQSLVGLLDELVDRMIADDSGVGMYWLLTKINCKMMMLDDMML